jgi:molecular chaperone HtpG
MEKIRFQIEIKRVLDVLSKEIYDSPFALLRENVQNAYDAILMRAEFSGGKWSAQKDGHIRVVIDNGKIIISDNGIGMSEITLKENYWKAGSSGKRTDLAIKSGVVGTFGIGAMANFGVCTRLQIETESLETKEKIVSEVERENLSLTEDCIKIEKITPIGEYGTTITIVLDPKSNIAINQAQGYLSSYVQYLPVKVELNGKNISQNSIEARYRDDNASIQKNWSQYEFGGIKGDILIQCNEISRVSAIVSDLSISGEKILGKIHLQQEAGPLWGFRSFFGLAPIPINLYYSFGGAVNLSIISPTAGREALSRESVELTQRLIQLVEICATKTLAELDLCNKSTPFMSHILSSGDIALAAKLKVRIEPDQELSLGELKEFSQRRDYNFYQGHDETIIRAYGTPATLLVILARSNPRRQIESQFIHQFCRVNTVDDAPKVIHTYFENQYSMEEVSFVIKTKNILEEDYALRNVEIKFSDISHNLPLIVEPPKNGQIKIFIQRQHHSIQPILRCYSESYDIFYGIIKDYIRVYIYPRVQSWVPSSTREGADALLKILRQKRELYEIRYEDVEFTSIFSDLVAGKITIEEVFNTAKNFSKIQPQEIKQQNIGKLENEIPNLVESPVQKTSEDSGPNFPPLPAIMRADVETDKKLLEVDSRNPILNNFQMFLSLSDRAFKEESDFFIAPHTTRIIWGGHRIIYIFSHASGKISLYYDIEMFEDTGDLAGGSIFPTTTIFTKRRIFIPVPENLKRFFELKEGKRSFYVRFDILP